MTLQVHEFKEYHCDVCGEVFRRYSWVEAEPECPRCKKLPPEDFDYPILDQAIEDVLGTVRDDIMRFVDDRLESVVEEISNEFRRRLNDKKKEENK